MGGALRLAAHAARAVGVPAIVPRGDLPLVRDVDQHAREKLQRVSGLGADFVPVPTDKPDRMVAGVTYAASEQIFVSILRARNEIIVKHEMLHQILYWWGERDWHDDARTEFKRCGLDVVS